MGYFLYSVAGYLYSMIQPVMKTNKVAKLKMQITCQLYTNIQTVIERVKLYMHLSIF